jgi:uncharacterized membrane protein
MVNAEGRDASLIAISLALVAASGLAHAVWNLFAKRSGEKSVFLWVMYIPTTVILLPELVRELAAAHFPPIAYGTIALSMLLQGVYALLLSHTYRIGDLSQVYPVMRGTSTLLVPLLGVAILRETLPAAGWLGIACMIGGFAVMSGWKLRRGGSGDAARPLLLALCVGLCITSYTLVDKLNLHYLSPPALLTVTNIGFILGLTPAVIASGQVRQALRSQWKIMLLGSILSPGSYLLFLFAIRDAQVAFLAPLREIGIVFGTLLGLLVLKERDGLRRIAASAIVVAGIVLIAGSALH